MTPGWNARRSGARVVWFALWLLAAGGVTAHAFTVPSGFSRTRVATGLTNPTAMEFAPDGRLFVCEKPGRVRVIRDGVLLPTPFVTVSVNPFGERGLLGIAFDPNFDVNRYVYVYYTSPTPFLHNRVSRFTASGDVAVPGSEVVILQLDPLSSATNHNGGAIHFGPDGKLYVAVGDNANGSSSQSLSTRHGKVLRINRDGSIPTDNPFYATASGANRAIWALGLRNPFTFAFHAQTGRMFVNDVGGSAWEEINDGLRGANYGWPATEGYTTNPAFVSPLYAYGHGSGSATGCAIAGAAFYDPDAFSFPSAYAGDYFFGDYCSGWIRRYDPATGTVTGFATGAGLVVDLKVSRDGKLYYADLGVGSIYEIAYGQSAPRITVQPASQTVTVGSAVTFSVTASGATPLTYRWRRNGTPISGAIASSLRLSSVSSSDSGARFSVVVSNAYGSVTSSDAVLTVTTNRPPVATITGPPTGTTYAGGQTITYSGSATDPESGTLSPGRLTWRVVFHHDTHTHPFLGPIAGVGGGSFVVPTRGETSSNVWYRIWLTATDPSGATHSVYRDVVPRVVRLSLAPNPAGLPLTLDGQPVRTPLSVTSVVGIVRRIGAPATHAVAGATWQFSSWSDGGAREHDISTPAVDRQYTARFTLAAVRVNFQPRGAVVPPGYLADSGVVFASGGNGLSYGWNLDTSSTTRDRNAAASPDQRHDTLVHLQLAANPNASWEIAVPNGTYDVRLVAGDPSYTDGVYRIAVEGMLALSGTPSATRRWFDATVAVTVGDGRLTVRNASGAVNNKLCFLEITRRP